MGGCLFDWTLALFIIRRPILAILIVFIFLVFPSSNLLKARPYGSFQNVGYHARYDRDTCTFTIPGVHPLFGDHISVRLRGIDAPEIRGQCASEKRKAKAARDSLRNLLRNASPTG